MALPRKKTTMISIMDIKDFIHYMKYIQYYHDDMHRIDLQFLKFLKVTLFKYYKRNCFRMFNKKYMELLEVVMEDKNHFITWYVLETEMGTKDNETMVDGRFKRINSYKALYELILWHRLNNNK